jgi:hypothetical protein
MMSNEDKLPVPPPSAPSIETGQTRGWEPRPTPAPLPADFAQRIREGVRRESDKPGT